MGEWAPARNPQLDPDGHSYRLEQRRIRRCGEGDRALGLLARLSAERIVIRVDDLSNKMVSEANLQRSYDATKAVEEQSDRAV